MLVERRGPNECWPWLGYIEDGYGRYFDGSKMRGAHELALEWTTGERRLAHLDTCHSCNNPACCNPSHLRFDTRRSNMRDAVVAGTAPRLKLTDEQVVELRLSAAAGAEGRRLAERYGVSAALVSGIVAGRRRRAAGGPIRTSHGNTKRKDFMDG